jgi:hypothetical protein
MFAQLNTKIAVTIAALAVTGAVAAPCASAAQVQIPPNLAHFQEPGSTGYVPTQVTIPAGLENLQEPGSTGYVPQTTHVVIPAALQNFREPGSTGFVPATIVTKSTGSGLDWASALIGAGAALGLALTGAGAFVTARKRRALAHA